MKEITGYEAEDGTIFSTVTACLQYEQYTRRNKDLDLWLRKHLGSGSGELGVTDVKGAILKNFDTFVMALHLEVEP